MPCDPYTDGRREGLCEAAIYADECARYWWWMAEQHPEDSRAYIERGNEASAIAKRLRQ